MTGQVKSQASTRFYVERRIATLQKGFKVMLESLIKKMEKKSVKENVDKSRKVRKMSERDTTCLTA